MSYVGLGIPWIALGVERLFGDSGFLCIYEPLVEIYKHTGNRSLIYLDCRHKRKFESVNDPGKTGVFPIYSPVTRRPSKSLDQTLDDATANTYIDGLCPVDFIVTNKNFALPHIAAQALTSKGSGIPVIYLCLNAGKDAVTKPVSKVRNTLHDVQVNNQGQFYLYMEAASYLTASLVVWTTEDQRRQGMEIAKRFLTPVEVARLKKRSMVNGCGITDLLRPHRKSDEQVKAELQTGKENFSVTFLGRVTGNKNVGYILDTMQPLFARHNIRLDMKSSKELPPSKRFGNNDGPESMISDELFLGGFASREDYAGKLLPSIQCMMYASIAEGYCITPREAVYIGVPVLVPKRPWAQTAFGPEYPFYYENQTEAFAMIKRIEDGRVTDREVQAFLSTRGNSYTCEFLSQVSMKLFDACRSLVDDRRNDFAAMAHTKLAGIFEEVTRLGEQFVMADLYKRLVKAGLSIGEGHSKRAMTQAEVYAFLGSRLECLNPQAGFFKRIS